MWLRPPVQACFLPWLSWDSSSVWCARVDPLRTCSDAEPVWQPGTRMHTDNISVSFVIKHKCTCSPVLTGWSWERLFVHTHEEEMAEVHWACWRSKALLPGHVILCQKKKGNVPRACIFAFFSQFLSFGFKYQILVAQTDPAFHHQLPRVVKGVTCLFLGKPLSTWDEQLTLSRVLTFVFRPFYRLGWPLIAFYRMIDWNMKRIVTSSCLPRQYYNRLSSNLKCKRWDIELKWFTDYIWCWRPCSFFIFYCLSLSLNRLYILIFQS